MAQWVWPIVREATECDLWLQSSQLYARGHPAQPVVCLNGDGVRSWCHRLPEGGTKHRTEGSVWLEVNTQSEFNSCPEKCWRGYGKPGQGGLFPANLQ